MSTGGEGLAERDERIITGPTERLSDAELDAMEEATGAHRWLKAISEIRQSRAEIRRLTAELEQAKRLLAATGRAGDADDLPGMVGNVVANLHAEYGDAIAELRDRCEELAQNCINHASDIHALEQSERNLLSRLEQRDAALREAEHGLRMAREEAQDGGIREDLRLERIVETCSSALRAITAPEATGGERPFGGALATPEPEEAA